MTDRATTTSAETALLEAVVVDYRTELAKKEMQLMRYREALVQHGIEPPDDGAEELLAMWERCRAVISTASAVVMELRSSKELLDDWSPPNAA